jgi:hypothetical protein
MTIFIKICDECGERFFEDPLISPNCPCVEIEEIAVSNRQDEDCEHIKQGWLYCPGGKQCQ